MATQWNAWIEVRTPAGMKQYNDRTRAFDIQPTMNRSVNLTVPDAGGYFNTRSLLEATYGPGSVKSLSEKRM